MIVKVIITVIRIIKYKLKNSCDVVDNSLENSWLNYIEVANRNSLT